jgi:tellurite resistance protein
LLGNLLQKARAAAGKATAQLNKVDDLERICLAAGGAMFADGKCEDKEYEAACSVIEGRFNGTFSRAQIEAALNKAVKVFEGGKFSGRRAVFSAMTQVESSEEGEAIFAAVLDVADSSGGIGEEEMPYIKELASKLRVNPASYGL